MASGTPNPPKEPQALQTTRQMPDELDALRARTLARPVPYAERPPAPPSPPSPLTGPKPPLLAATLTLLAPVPVIDPPHPTTNPTHLSALELPPVQPMAPSYTTALPDLPAAEATAP